MRLELLGDFGGRILDFISDMFNYKVSKISCSFAVIINIISLNGNSWSNPSASIPHYYEYSSSISHGFHNMIYHSSNLPMLSLSPHLRNH